jgi:hypothetical protein
VWFVFLASPGIFDAQRPDPAPRPLQWNFKYLIKLLEQYAATATIARKTSPTVIFKII